LHVVRCKLFYVTGFLNFIQMGLCHSLVRSDQQAANSLAHGFKSLGIALIKSACKLPKNIQQYKSATQRCPTRVAKPGPKKFENIISV